MSQGPVGPAATEPELPALLLEPELLLTVLPWLELEPELLLLEVGPLLLEVGPLPLLEVGPLPLLEVGPLLLEPVLPLLDPGVLAPALPPDVPGDDSSLASDRPPSGGLEPVEPHPKMKMVVPNTGKKARTRTRMRNPPFRKPTQSIANSGSTSAFRTSKPPAL